MAQIGLNSSSKEIISACEERITCTRTIYMLNRLIKAQKMSPSCLTKTSLS
jgi:hypothetical protein